MKPTRMGKTEPVFPGSRGIPNLRLICYLARKRIVTPGRSCAVAGFLGCGKGFE